LQINLISNLIKKDNLNYHEIVPSFSKNQCEKNWVLYNDNNNEIKVIYEWYPLKICKINEDNHTLDLLEIKNNVPLLFKKIRGSTNGYLYNNEYWFVGHIVAYTSPRNYYNIIIIFDINMNLLRYSAPFKFDSTPIEYCIGLIVEPTRIIMNYSSWDRTTIMGIYDMDYILDQVIYKP